MKLTKQGILDLNAALNSCGNLTGVKFAYAIARNKTKLKPEIEAMQEAYKASDSFLQYDKERIELAIKHAKKIDGKPQIENGEYVIEDKEKFDNDLKLLRETHREAIEARGKQEKDFTELLKEEVEIDLYTIPPSYVPENISANQMTGIISIVQEELKN